MEKLNIFSDKSTKPYFKIVKRKLQIYKIAWKIKSSYAYE